MAGFGLFSKTLPVAFSYGLGVGMSQMIFIRYIFSLHVGDTVTLIPRNGGNFSVEFEFCSFHPYRCECNLIVRKRTGCLSVHLMDVLGSLIITLPAGPLVLTCFSAEVFPWSVVAEWNVSSWPFGFFS